MTTFEPIKSRLARNEIVLSAAVGRVMHHNVVQMIGLAGGFHALWFDHEHCGLTIEQLEVGTLAARSVGLDTFVRIPPTDYALVTALPRSRWRRSDGRPGFFG